jgi:hypothetical protein
MLDASEPQAVVPEQVCPLLGRNEMTDLTFSTLKKQRVELPESKEFSSVTPEREEKFRESYDLTPMDELSDISNPSSHALGYPFTQDITFDNVPHSLLHETPSSEAEAKRDEQVLLTTPQNLPTGRPFLQAQVGSPRHVALDVIAEEAHLLDQDSEQFDESGSRSPLSAFLEPKSTLGQAVLSFIACAFEG